MPARIAATAAPVALLLVLTALVAGCSSDDDGCQGRAYHADRDQAGAETPIQALEAWLGSHDGFDVQPPDEDWIVVDSGDRDAAEVVITNDRGDGWWVSALRTTHGGYVVDQATDDWASCKGELS